MSWFSDYIGNIAVLLIFISFLGIILPSSKYKQYISLVSGLVLIIIIISPVNKLLNGSGSDFENLLNQVEMDVNKSIITNERSYYQNSQLDMVMKTYKSDLIDQIVNNLKNKGYDVAAADVSIDASDENFGEITYMYIEIVEKPAEEKPPHLIKIDKVKVDRGMATELENNASNGETDTESTIILKNLLSDFYNLSVDNIYIKVIK